MEDLATHAASWGVHLEGPEELAALLEVGTHGVDLVDHVLHADDRALGLLAQTVLNNLVVRERHALAVDLRAAALVQEVAHRLERRVAVHDVRVHLDEVVKGGLVEAHEHTIVDLQQPEHH